MQKRMTAGLSLIQVVMYCNEKTETCAWICTEPRLTWQQLGEFQRHHFCLPISCIRLKLRAYLLAGQVLLSFPAPIVGILFGDRYAFFAECCIQTA